MGVFIQWINMINICIGQECCDIVTVLTRITLPQFTKNCYYSRNAIGNMWLHIYTYNSVHSFNKHTLSTYSLLDTVLSSGSIIMNKIRKVVFRKCFQSNNIWEESLKNIIRRVKELNIDKRKYNLFLTELLKVVFFKVEFLHTSLSSLILKHYIILNEILLCWHFVYCHIY